MKQCYENTVPRTERNVSSVLMLVLEWHVNVSSFSLDAHQPPTIQKWHFPLAS